MKRGMVLASTAIVTLALAACLPTGQLAPLCTPPACPAGVLVCPGECPGGCGFRCATFTPPAAPPEAADAVTGWVEIENGVTIVGGIAGETLPIEVAFGAESPAGDIADMRVATTCWKPCSADQMAAAPWEPFAARKEYPFLVPLNFVGFYVSVQYRDELGRLSPIYSDVISVEGMPAPPTPTPPTVTDAALYDIVEPVWNCQPLENGQYVWFEVRVTYLGGTPTVEEVLSGPYTGPWQPNCPVPTGTPSAPTPP